MTAKEFFLKICDLDHEIDRKLKKLGELKMGSSAIRGISYQEDRVSGSGNGEPPFVRLIEKIEKLDAEINTDIDRLADMKEQACAIMADFPEQEQNVLKYRYLRGYSWADTADTIGCTVRHAHRLKEKAFARFGTQDIVFKQDNLTTCS